MRRTIETIASLGVVGLLSSVSGPTWSSKHHDGGVFAEERKIAGLGTIPVAHHF
jgi:hypothetical protein